MRVALVRGSLCANNAYKAAFDVLMPPLGLASLAGAIKGGGHKTVMIDALAENLGVDEVAEIILSTKSELVGVTISTSPFYGFAVDLAKKIKAENKDVILVAGGQHATFLYSQVLRNGFDFVVLGEGEETFSQLANALEHKEPVSKVNGLALKLKGKIVKTDRRLLINNLDALPIPAFELFNRSKCNAKIFGAGSYLITMETSRGCPYNCEFCSVTAMWGHCWRFKSVRRVLKELELIKSLGYNWIFIVDDNFIVPINVKEREFLFKEIQSTGLGSSLNLIAQIRADLAASRPDTIKLAANSGLRIAFLGMESGSNDVLKTMRKGLNRSIAIEGIKVLHKNGILTHGGFVIGAPYESKHQLNSTFRYADQLRMAGLDSAQFSIYTPLPGTDAFSKALKCNSLVTLNWNLYDCFHPVIKTQNNPYILYFKSRTASKLFFFKKWASSNFLLSKHSEHLNDEYSELVKNATDFIGKNLIKYMKGLLLLPLSSLMLWSILRKNKLTSYSALQIIKQTKMQMRNDLGVFSESVATLNATEKLS